MNPTQAIQILDREIETPRAWTRSTLLETDWRIPVSAACREEILAWLDFIRQHSLPVLLRSPDQFATPHCWALIEQIRRVLDQGVGHAVLDRLPVDEMDKDEAKTLVWVLGSMLGRLVPQKWDGTIIYDVRDQGTPYTIGIRASVTNAGLDFHTDTPFNDFVPNYVMLLCLYPAPEGGLSRALSLASVHNILRQQFKSHLLRLYQPFYFDRQKEHASNEPRIRKYPVFTFDGQLRARCNPTLIRNGYELAGEALDRSGDAALTVLQDVLSDESLWWEATLERGQVQFLNNFDLAHTRTAFRDAESFEQKRHLVRYWVRNEGPVFFL
jgi:alpha-ketoglutarate-dependent taurine dioxygenase